MNTAIDLEAIAKELGGEWIELSEGEPEQDTRSAEERREMDEEFEAALSASDEPEDDTCWTCRGSGEGRCEDDKCSACGGSGVLNYRPEQYSYDELY